MYETVAFVPTGCVLPLVGPAVCTMVGVPQLSVAAGAGHDTTALQSPVVFPKTWLPGHEVNVGTVVSMVTVIEPQVAPETHPPSPRAKYVVVVVGFTTMLVPFPRNVPPQLPLYQAHWVALPSVPVRLRVVGPLKQLGLADALITGTEGCVHVQVLVKVKAPELEEKPVTST